MHLQPYARDLPIWPFSSAVEVCTLKNRFLCKRAKDGAMRGTMSATLLDITGFAYQAYEDIAGRYMSGIRLTFRY